MIGAIFCMVGGALIGFVAGRNYGLEEGLDRYFRRGYDAGHKGRQIEIDILEERMRRASILRELSILQ